jgi:hypothetical protein
MSTASRRSNWVIPQNGFCAMVASSQRKVRRHRSRRGDNGTLPGLTLTRYLLVGFKPGAHEIKDTYGLKTTVEHKFGCNQAKLEEHIDDYAKDGIRREKPAAIILREANVDRDQDVLDAATKLPRARGIRAADSAILCSCSPATDRVTGTSPPRCSVSPVPTNEMRSSIVIVVPRDLGA